VTELKASLVLQLKNMLRGGIAQVRGELKGLKSEAQGLGAIKGPNAAGMVAYGRSAREASQAVRELKRNQAVLGGGGAGATIMAGTTGLGRMMGGLGWGMLAGAGATFLAASQLKDAARIAAERERAMTRIAITGDASREQQLQATQDIERLANRTATSVKDVREGLDSLVASGRSLPEAMKFLPSVVNTAQAAGAAVVDIAKSADAVSGSLGVAADRMESAFDIMATGGKLGKFELRDMAQYLPELAPMAKEAGMKGEAGLAYLVSALQQVRKEVGTSGEAATNLKNVFAKMFSAETEKKFEKMGVDLPKAMEEAKKQGKNLLETFVDLTAEATKGDMTKLPKLFEDMQAQGGMRALLNNRTALREMLSDIGKTAQGTVQRDLQRVLNDSQSSMDRVGSAALRLGQNVGDMINKSRAASGVLGALAEGLNKVNDAMERNDEIERKLKEAGVKPLGKLQTAAEAEADRVLRQAKHSDEELRQMTDGGFQRVRPKDTRTEQQKRFDEMEEAFRARRRYVEEQEAESRRLRARDPIERAREDGEIRSGTGAVGAALGDVRAQITQQRRAGATPATVDKAIAWSQGRLDDVLHVLAKGGLSPDAQQTQTEVARLLVRRILNQQRRKAGETVEAPDADVNSSLQRQLDDVKAKLGEVSGEADKAGSAVKDKLTLDLTSQGAATAMSWANGLRAGVPAVEAAANALRAPIMTPPAGMPSAPRPITGGGASAPSRPSNVQVTLNVTGVQDPEKAARIAETRLASAIRGALAGAHHDGVT